MFYRFANLFSSAQQSWAVFNRYFYKIFINFNKWPIFYSSIRPSIPSYKNRLSSSQGQALQRININHIKIYMVFKGTRTSRFAFWRPQMISSTVLLNVRKPVGSEEEIDPFDGAKPRL